MSLSGRNRYVALGSSFAAGPGLDPLVAPSQGRSAVNYPHLVAARLGLELVDVTSAGATTEHVLDTAQVLPDGSHAQPQLEAVSPDADLVTLTVGGNDVEYVLSLLRCSSRVDPEAVPPGMRAHLATDLAAVDVSEALVRLPERISTLLDAIALRAPHARVVVVDYLSVVPATPPSQAVMPLSDGDRRRCADLGAALEAATAEGTARTGAELVRAGAASRDHAVGSPHAWVGGWEFGDVSAGGRMPYHPNAAGMRAVAELLIKHLG